MNIALVVPGGVDRSERERVVPGLLWLIERLAQRHTVLVVALRQEAQPASYWLRGARVVNLGEVSGKLPGRRLWQQVQHLRQLLAVVRGQPGGVDVLHALWIGQTGLVTTMAGRLLHTPTVLSIGGGECVWLPQIQYGGLGNWRSRWRLRWALHWASAITAGSRYAQQQLPPRHRHATWLPLGVDTARFRAAVARPAGPPWRLLQVASINRVKDPHTLLHALRRVVDRQPGVYLDWVGEDTLAGEMHRLAAELGLGEVVHFHGFQPTDVVAELARRAHLYVQSSWHEGQGVAVLEAAAAGVPTVGTGVGLVAELAPSAALAVPVGDAASLGDGILVLLRDPARRAGVGQAAQDWADQYDAAWTAAQFEALYAGLLAA